MIHLSRGYLRKSLNDVNSAISLLQEKAQLSEEEINGNIESTDYTSTSLVTPVNTELLQNYKEHAKSVQDRIDLTTQQIVSASISSAVSSGITYWAQSTTIRNSRVVPSLFFPSRSKVLWAPQTASIQRYLPLPN
jgi:hypothetical protein